MKNTSCHKKKNTENEDCKCKKPTRDKLKNFILKNDLSSFIAKAFFEINPSVQYLHNWHIDLIAEYLKMAYEGKITRLIINMPPRYLKSVSISVAFPSWVLGSKPNERVIVASYSELLAVKHSTDSRLIVNSKWYRELFPEFEMSSFQNEKHKFSTTQNGYRFATSVGGTLTGEGGNFLIVDDPHNPQQVLSPKYRQKTLDWFDNTFASRLNDKKKGVIIVVMQRLHENDLSGYLLNKKGNRWIHLNIPAVSEEEIIYSIGDFYKVRRKGELLHSAREGIKEIEQIKFDLGSYSFAAQYQQSPVGKSNGMIKDSWIRYYNVSKTPVCSEVVLSFDTAIKIGVKNDPTVCTVWGIYDNCYYLLDLHRQWLEYPSLKKRVLELSKIWNPEAILIEDKASGQSLIQDLKKETKLNIIPIKVNKDKVTRFASVTATFEAGRVFIPNEIEWLADFEKELFAFPNCEHDDQVDSVSQYLQWVKHREVKKKVDVVGRMRMRRL